MRDLTAEVLELFAEAQEPLADRIRDAWHEHRQERLQAHADYYALVRTQPQRRERENAAMREKRRAARLARAAARPPCPHCGAPVTRGAVVPRGCKLPTYCSRKCMRAATWKRWYERRGRASRREPRERTSGSSAQQLAEPRLDAGSDQ